jgi:hypothetical protein
MERILVGATERRNLRVIADDQPLEVYGLEFLDGYTPLNNNSMTGFRLTLLSTDLFKSMKSTAVRTLIIRASESRSVHAPVCFTVEERQELDEIFPTYAPFSSHIPVARLRLLLHEYCALVGFEYGSRRVLIPITHSTGDVKAVNQLLAQDNKCCCCQMPYESYYERIYGCAGRTSYTNAADWRQFLVDGADIIAYAGVSKEVCKSLNQVHTLPNILETLALANQAFSDAAKRETSTVIPHPLLTRQTKVRAAVGTAQDTIALGKVLEGDASANSFRFRLHWGRLFGPSPETFEPFEQVPL